MNNAGRQCAVCHAEMTQICGGCGNVSYCSREHQKQHWKQHKWHCTPYKICTNHQLGSHMVASRNLKAGELIFREKAAATGPKNGSKPVCLSCYAVINKDNARHCPGCNFPFCSQKCTESPVHSEECKILSRGKDHIRFADYDREYRVYDCILTLRCLLLKESRPKDYEHFRNLETHKEKRRGSATWRVNQVIVVKLLRECCHMEQQFTEEEIHEAWCAVVQNEVDCPTSGSRIRGIFPFRHSFLAHNCIANVNQSIHDDFELITRTSVPVKRGEVLFVSSVTARDQSTKERQAFLRENKFFECNCARCSDPTECQTYFGALKCKQCPVGNVLALKPLEPDSDWKCDHCSYRLTSADVDKITDKLENVYDALVDKISDRLEKEYEPLVEKDIEVLESFLQSHTSLLHPNHYLFTNTRRLLSRLYSKIPRRLLETRSPALLERQIDICQKLLSIADVLDPGLSCSRGNILNEMRQHMHVLAANRYENKDILEEEFVDLMVQVRNRFEETYRILSMEPAKSREGITAKHMRTIFGPEFAEFGQIHIDHDGEVL